MNSGRRSRRFKSCLRHNLGGGESTPKRWVLDGRGWTSYYNESSRGIAQWFEISPSAALVSRSYTDSLARTPATRRRSAYAPVPRVRCHSSSILDRTGCEGLSIYLLQLASIRSS